MLKMVRNRVFVSIGTLSMADCIFTFTYVLQAFINVIHKNRKDMKPEHEEPALNSHCWMAVNNDGIILETVTQRIFYSTPKYIHMCKGFPWSGH